MSRLYYGAYKVRIGYMLDDGGTGYFWLYLGSYEDCELLCWAFAGGFTFEGLPRATRALIEPHFEYIQ